ncbi:MAG TPA: GH25 family lysozyme [Mycobacteriales bacterium]|nr:GH25 family lysozyme [Mycobacteriales bacterium]
MHRRLRIAAVVTAALALGSGALQLTPASAATPTPDFCTLFCPPTTPTPTPTSTHAATDSPTPTPSLTTTPTGTPTGTPTASPSPTITPTTINGPDVASYQHPATAAYPGGKPINWNAVAAAGMSFAIVKATESNNYTNPFFADDYAGALSAGLVHGAYHFARPAYPVSQTAMAQAQYFAKRIGAVDTPDTLPPVLDLEVTGGLPRADLVTWAQIFLYRLRTLTGRTPMLYTYPSFWTDVLDDPSAFSRFPLWMASYGSSAPSADIWQYTDSATINGISGKVDESTYLGTGGSELPWSTLSDGTAAVPWPTAVPKAPHAVTAVAGPATATVSWVPGNDGSARTTSYVVTASPGGLTTKVSGAATSATVKVLDPTVSYTFTVTAVSGAGSSAPSTPTPPLSPVVPTQIAPVQPASINYGQPLGISAVLSRTDTTPATPISGQPVTVLRKAPAAKTWKTFATTTTASDGSVNVTLHPPSAVEVEFVFKGAAGYERATATSTTVVHAVVTAALSKTRIKHGKTVTLTGTVSPVIDGEQVMLESKVNGKWQTGPVKTVNSQGGFTYRIKAAKKGVAQSYQVLASPGHGVASGTSAPVTLTVT